MSYATLRQATKVLELISQKKVPSERLQRLLKGGFIADLLEVNGGLDRDAFRQFLQLGNLYPDLTELKGIVIPEDATVETLESAGGCDFQANYVKQYFTSEHFKVTVHGSRNLFLAHFNKAVTSQHVEAVAKEMGYEVGLVEDLLCVAAQSEYRELQRQFRIIALGSSTDVCGDRRVPALCGLDGDGRHLQLRRSDHEWGDSYRFLFVGKDRPLDA